MEGTDSGELDQPSDSSEVAGSDMVPLPCTVTASHAGAASWLVAPCVRHTGGRELLRARLGPSSP